MRFEALKKIPINHKKRDYQEAMKCCLKCEQFI